MKRDYLPIGTVVLLKKGKKPLMIYGRTQKIENVDNLVDYIGVPYPEGFISNDMWCIILIIRAQKKLYIAVMSMMTKYLFANTYRLK